MFIGMCIQFLNVNLKKCSKKKTQTFQNKQGRLSLEGGKFGGVGKYVCT